MKIKFKKYIYILGISLFVFLLGCESFDLELQDDPNVPPADALDPDTNLNFVLFSLSNFFTEATEAGAEAVRLEYMFDTYEVNFQNNDTNLANMWAIAYADILSEISTIEPTLIATERFHHLGILKVVRAYTLMTLVDFYGDVPFSEIGETFPFVDASGDVYEQALADLDDAIVQLSKDEVEDLGGLFRDNFYGGNIAQWIKLANTLKFKYYLNTRLVDQATAAAEISDLLTEDLISDPTDDFKWAYSTTANPQSKHPYYVQEYDAANTGEYIPNYLAWAMTIEKGMDDPRLRYYIYRQVDAFPTDPAVLNNEIDCWNDNRPSTYAVVDAISAEPLPFCALFDRGDGYWGRDHANNAGIPPDNAKRMTFGTYPVGGRFDDDAAEDIDSGEGLNGEGIWPIMMSSYVYFMRAEAALYLGTGEDPRGLLETGVRESINSVINYSSQGSYLNDLFTEIVEEDDTSTVEDEEVVKGDLFATQPEDIDDYVTEVLTLYDAAASDDERMAVIGKEYWLAMYGNGIEGYNLYRRTGTPINLQPTLLGTGNFPRSFLYPNNSVDRNPNINQKSGLTEKVFWDNNPDGFIQ